MKTKFGRIVLVAVCVLIGGLISAQAGVSVAGLGEEPSAPVVVKAPVSQTGAEGSNIVFTVTAEGTEPLSYQWVFNGTPLADATNSWLRLLNLQSSDVGEYSVVISNAVGVVTSDPATLNVVAMPPQIVLQPKAGTNWPGGTAMMSVAATGTLPMYYQWKVNGGRIFGATNSVLSLSNLQFSDGGTYSVTVSNKAGSRTSSSVALNISQVVCWGAGKGKVGASPEFGQSMIPAEITDTDAIAAGGYHSLELWHGQASGWGNGSYLQTSVNLFDGRSIACGLYFSMGLRSNGTVYSWGANTEGQCTVSTAATNVMAIAAGWYHGMALRSNGTVVAWGAKTPATNFGQALVPADLGQIKAIAGGGFHSLALRGDGRVVAWGRSLEGQTSVPAGLSDVIAVAAGGSNSVALKSDGTVVVWGDNTHGQTNVPAGLSDVVAISAGAAHIMALKSDGSVVCWGNNVYGQTDVPNGLAKVTSISAGGFHNMALVNYGPVTFMSQPCSQTVYTGNDAVFTAACLGAEPLLRQWKFNGVAMPGETNNVLKITGVARSDAGKYWLTASNAFGAVTGVVAVLTVDDYAPFITQQPTNQYVMPGSNVVLGVSCGGYAPLNYQWQFNGADLAGATNATLAVTNFQGANVGFYVLCVSNAYGSATSSNVSLNIVDLPYALGATNLDWSNPTQGWQPQRTNTHDGFAAVAAGPLAYGNQAVLQTHITGPGKLSFWWLAPTSYGLMTFSMDGTRKASSGNLASARWQQYTFDISPGVHALEWSCINNWSSGGYGMGCLDDVVFSPGAIPVTITTQPASQVVSAGSGVTFSVSASGTPPISYQWYFNGAAVAGGTSSILYLGNVQSSAAGNYYVAVDNGAGVVASSNAVLTVTPSAPVFTSQPANSLQMAGGQTAFSASAVGTSPISYQWECNGVPMSGQTNNSLIMSNVQVADMGSYRLRASNSVGTAVSSNAVLALYTTDDLAAAVNNPGGTWSVTNVPWFPQTNTTHDGSLAAQSGVISNAQRSVLQTIVTGPATVTYWWKVNCDSFWVNLAFAVNDTVLSTAAGNVDWQKVTNYIGAGSQVLTWKLCPVYSSSAGGSAWLDEVEITPGGTRPEVAMQPVSKTVNAGDSVTFTAGAIGTPPLRYQWQFNGVAMAGFTNATLVLKDAQGANTGEYSVVVSNDWGWVCSSNATLMVNNSAPVIVTQPDNQLKAVNSSASFFVWAKGSSPLRYQWLLDGSPIEGATSNVLSVLQLQETNSGKYCVIVTNDLGSATSSVVVLRVTRSVVVDCWPGSYSTYVTQMGVDDAIGLAVGRNHTAVRLRSGSVVCYGTNSYGVTNVPSGLGDVAALAAGDYHTLALRSNGTVVAWGDNSFGQSQVPGSLSNAVAVAAAANHSFALTADGRVVGWGNNDKGQLNIPEGLRDVKSISAGVYNGFAVKKDGTVVQWGANGLPNVGSGRSHIVAVATGSASAWTLDDEGYLWAWGFLGRAFPVASGVVTVSSAYGSDPWTEYFAAVRSDGIAGTGGLPGMGVPQFPNGLSNVIAVAAGYGHAAALIGDGMPRVIRTGLDWSAIEGARVWMSSGVVGTLGEMSYRWLLNGNEITGATNQLLVITNSSVADRGVYSCVVGNRFGVVTNEVGNVAVRTIPRFEGGPAVLSGGVSLRLNKLSGHGAITIYSSSNLVDWVPVFTNVPVNGSLDWNDGSGTNEARFYRAVEK